MARFLSVWSPNWPITCLRRRSRSGPPAEPFALVETVKNARRLSAVSEDAAALGLRPGQTLADALALEPGLQSIDADPEADLSALEALCDWCVRFSPAVAPDPPDGLMLDVTGAAYLWGGETELVQDLLERLCRAEIPARAAIADTAGAAWALARYAYSPAEPDDLRPLPVEALRLDPEDAATLVRLGIGTVGALAALPRAELTRRFGPGVRLRLDQALGDAAEAIRFRRPPSPFFVRVSFAEPISAPEDLERVAADLATAMAAQLASEGKGARRFELGFHRLDGRTETLSVGTASPSRDPKRLTRLLRPKLETVDPGFGIEVATLYAEEAEPLADRQAELSRGDEEAGACDFEALVDRLANRLGEDRVWRVEPFESWIPERAVVRTIPLGTATADKTWPTDRPRPVRLFQRPEPIEALAPVPDDPPVQFRWRGRLHRVRRAEGPERLAQEWWRKPGAEIADAGKVRDYYRVEDAEGRRFWIFRAGLYAPDRAARWWLHGLFG
jgi:protein ImuB